MTSDDLTKKAAELGFRLFEPDRQSEMNKTLAEVVKSRDLRFWEAFPVMLANTAEAGQFNHKTVRNHLSDPEKKVFNSLLSASLAVCESLGFKFDWAKVLASQLSAKILSEHREKMRYDTGFKIGGVLLLPKKLKANFTMYFKKPGDSVKNTVAVREELGLEFAMSQIYTGRQKELFLKKLRREKMTKTEKEYFSRVVRKKAQALANEDLHHLARKVLE